MGGTHPLGKPVEDQKREALAAALCGIKVMRVDFYWESMQPTAQSELNFKRFDDALRVFEEQGIEFQAIYCYLPKWAAAKDWKPLSMKFTGKPRPDYGLWRRFIRSAAGHYRGKLRYVEVWNEPDHVGFANFSALEYIELMKIAYAETKRADPNMQVLTGGYTCMPNGFVKLVEKDHMQRTLVEGRGAYDIFAFHGHGPFHDYRNQIRPAGEDEEGVEGGSSLVGNETGDLLDPCRRTRAGNHALPQTYLQLGARRNGLQLVQPEEQRFRPQGE